MGGDALWLVLLIQIVVASAGAVLLFQIGLTISGSPRAATIGALFYALDPYSRAAIDLVHRAAVPRDAPLWALQQILATTSSKGGAAGDAQQALVGALLGALVFTRASLGPVVVVAVGLLARRRGWRAALVAGATTALVIAPWLIRNYRLDGSLLPSRVGENLFASTSPFAVGFLPEHDVDLLMPFVFQIVDRELAQVPPPELHAATERLLRARAVEFARSNPAETLALKTRNVCYLFWPGLLPVEAKSDDTSAVLEDSRVRIVGAQPRPRSWEWLHLSVRSVLLACALVGLVVRRRRWREDAILLAVILTVAVVHVVFFPNHETARAHDRNAHDLCGDWGSAGNRSRRSLVD